MPSTATSTLSTSEEHSKKGHPRFENGILALKIWMSQTQTQDNLIACETGVGDSSTSVGR
jgi:hypothetical protein